MTNYCKKSLIYIISSVLLSLNALAGNNHNYFQQEVHYKISASLDDKLHTLNCNMELEYINNSPDTLREIWMHLWPNAYKSKESALVKQQVEDGNSDLYFAREDERGHIDGVHFTSEGKSLVFQYKAIDYGLLILDKPLLPSEKIIIKTPFMVKLPSARFSRSGHEGQAYYISQWYPKPAVYDKDGWHPMSYLDIGEFYSEFGSFDVSLTLPANYVVCATGELQNKEEVSWLNLKSSEDISDKSDNTFPASSPSTKTLNYKQNNVHDFAWFADKRYLVRKGSVILPNTGRRIDTWAYFTPKNSRIWKNAVAYINQAIVKYSEWNGDYLYSSCAAAEGALAVSDGMEYPMVTLLTAHDSISLENTIVHEVGHNWFYGMLGSNERENPWMDEGINSANELRYTMEKYKYVNSLSEINISGFGSTVNNLFGFSEMNFRDFWQIEYYMIAANRFDQPANLTAPEYNWMNYGAVVYRKVGLSFEYLRAYLGDELYDKCMKRYFREWSLKHPSPEDLRKIFKEETNNDLNWFWNGILSMKGAVDYKIRSCKSFNDRYEVRVINKGEIAAPFLIQGIRNDSIVYSEWKEGFVGDSLLEVNGKNFHSILIDKNRIIPEQNYFNNNIYTEGVFKKRDKFSLGLLPKFYADNSRRVCVFPSLGWNEYNKWMPGLTIYNKTIPYKKFEYSITGLYGFADESWAGSGSASYNLFLKKGLFEYAGIGVHVKRFAFDHTTVRTGEFSYENPYLHYLRWEPNIEFHFRRKNVRSTVRNRIYASMVNVEEEGVELKNRLFNYNITGIESRSRYIYRCSFLHFNFRSVDPYLLKLGGEGNSDYQKFHLTAEYMLSYAAKGKGVNFRFFSGAEVVKNLSAAYPFNLSGWSGLQDYWFDNYYFGRSENTGLLSQQMSVQEGGFKTDLPYASSVDWLSALNITIDLPGALPLSVFIDAGTFKGAKDWIAAYGAKGSIIYDGGICFSAGFAKVYFPIIKSEDIKGYQSGDYGIDRISFGKQIRFEVDLNKINPFYLRQQLIR